MPSFNKFHQFISDFGAGVHDFQTDTLAILLTNDLPSLEAEIAASLTAVDPTFLASDLLTTVSADNVGGIISVQVADFTVLADGGVVGPFRYVVIFNSTTAEKVDPLIGYYDLDTIVTLADTETILLDFNQTVGMLVFS